LFAAGWAVVQLPIVMQWFLTDTMPPSSDIARGEVAITIAAGLTFSVGCFLASGILAGRVKFVSTDDEALLHAREQTPRS
jgi:hypothetical protein